MYPHYSIEFSQLVRPYLRDDCRGVKPDIQVLSIIRFLAEGHYQKGLGADYICPLSQTSVSRYIHSVIPAILQLSSRFIKFPHNHEQRRAISDR